LIRLLTHPVFESGKTWTTFIDDTPELFKLVQSQNRAQKLLAYLGDVAVNGSSIMGQMGEPGLKTEAMIPVIVDNNDSSKVVDTSVPCENGWRNIIVNEGPEAFAKAIRGYKGCVSGDIDRC
jgi:pyruvate carboxylase